MPRTTSKSASPTKPERNFRNPPLHFGLVGGAIKNQGLQYGMLWGMPGNDADDLSITPATTTTTMVIYDNDDGDSGGDDDDLQSRA